MKGPEEETEPCATLQGCQWGRGLVRALLWLQWYSVPSPGVLGWLHQGMKDEGCSQLPVPCSQLPAPVTAVHPPSQLPPLLVNKPLAAIPCWKQPRCLVQQVFPQPLLYDFLIWKQHCSTGISPS